MTTYVGGPLDGQEAEPRGRGGWSTYRDDTGRPIPARVGDREHVRRANRGDRVRRFYARQGQRTYQHPDGRVRTEPETYRHGSLHPANRNREE